LASSQTVPAAVCVSKGAMTPRGEQVSRRQSSAESRKRIKWSNSLDQDLLKCAGKVQTRKGGGQMKELLKLWEEIHFLVRRRPSNRECIECVSWVIPASASQEEMSPRHHRKGVQDALGGLGSRYHRWWKRPRW